MSSPASLRDALAAAAAAWPALPPPDDAFVTFARDRLCDGTALDDAALATCPYLADLLLAHHAIRGDPHAVPAITAQLAALRHPLRRTGADETLIDDLLRDLPAELIAPREDAAPRLHGYRGRGPLPAWLRVIAVRAVVERRRRREGSPADVDATIAELATPELDPELALLRRRYGDDFRAAFAWAVDGLVSADRALLRQHHIDGVSLDALAGLHRVHRATVARRLAAARGEIFDRVRRRLVHELRVGGDTVDSILRLVRSELDVSLGQYL